jgi:hypothetical protein
LRYLRSIFCVDADCHGRCGTRSRKIKTQITQRTAKRRKGAGAVDAAGVHPESDMIGQNMRGLTGLAVTIGT